MVHLTQKMFSSFEEQNMLLRAFIQPPLSGNVEGKHLTVDFHQVWHKEPIYMSIYREAHAYELYSGIALCLYVETPMPINDILE